MKYLFLIALLFATPAFASEPLTDREVQEISRSLSMFVLGFDPAFDCPNGCGINGPNWPPTSKEEFYERRYKTNAGLPKQALDKEAYMIKGDPFGHSGLTKQKLKKSPTPARRLFRGRR